MTARCLKNCLIRIIPAVMFGQIRRIVPRKRLTCCRYGDIENIFSAKGRRNRKLTEWEKQGNRTRSRTRARIEHIFGVQAQKAGNLLLRTIGIIRAQAKIGLRNLAYNLDRYRVLVAVTA